MHTVIEYPLKEAVNMPRAARVKAGDAMYHIMVRSISETDLFRTDDDREEFLKRLKRYCEKYGCTIYAYCLMDTHAHFYIDPRGFDISLFMRSLNTSYAVYYNKTYHRRGPLLQGRFASVIVDSDAYAVTLTAYIHNNAKDLPGYAGREELYRYSSYGIYTGRRKDAYGLVDKDFILELFSSDGKRAVEKYRAFVEAMKGTGILKEVDDDIVRAYTENENKSWKSCIIRSDDPKGLIEKINEYLGDARPEDLRAKYSREAGEYRAFVTYVMRSVCGYKNREICEYIGNMSMSGISRLSNKGFRLAGRHERYREAFNSLFRAG
jgi:putative transposase